MLDIEKEFNEFINSSDPYSRENPIGHITGSCWILNNKLDSTLLTHHRKLNIWIPTGGHSENEEVPSQIALREGEEETGLKLRFILNEPFFKAIHSIPRYKNVLEHKHYDYTFIFRPIGSEEYFVSDESHDLKWVPLIDIEKYTKEENVILMRDKTINLIKSGNITILE